MKSEPALLDFLLETHCSLQDIRARELPLSALRAQAEDVARAQGAVLSPTALGATLAGGAHFLSVPEHISDIDLCRTLTGKEPSRSLEAFLNLAGAQGACPMAVVQVPLAHWAQAAWHEASEGDASPESGLSAFVGAVGSAFGGDRDAPFLLMRGGFLGTEFDVLESVVMGFRGVFLWARGRDVFTLQLLTEVCRDFKMCLIWMVESEDSLARVLETDAPFVCLSALEPTRLERNLPFLQKAFPKIPRTTARMAWVPGADPGTLTFAKTLGFQIAFGSPA